jgi:hypothetical protein
MTNAENQYFALMRAALWGQPVKFDETPDWKGIMRMARHHTTNVLVAEVASRLTDNAPTENMLGTMKNEMRGNLINQLELKQILTMAVKALRQKGIEPVLLKGFGLSMLYPNPNLRQFGDIDLFVGRDNFQEACAVLRSLPGGYNWGEVMEAGHHYNIEFGHHPMEVHYISADVYDPKEMVIYAAIEKDGLFEHLRHVDFEGFDLAVPSKEFEVFFTFFHAWHHFMTTGVGWRQLSDVAMTLHAYHGQYDMDKLRQWLTSMHLMQPWQAFGVLMVEHLGLPVAEIPFYGSVRRRRVQELYKRIMAEGNFRRPNRFKSRKPKGRLAKKLHTFFDIFVDFFQLANVFPAQAFHGMRTSFRRGFWKNFQKK